jgi:peptide/nickel transport system ATP-binding protein
MSMIFITRDIGITAHFCDRVALIYEGEIVESARTERFFENPMHPYTRGLMRAIPRLDVEADAAGTRPRLQEIPGLVPILTQPIVGCAFAARCELATDRCRAMPPPFVDAGGGHTVACWEVKL